MPALHHLAKFVLHIIAQIIEAEFIVGAVGDVGRVCLPTLVIVEPVHDDAHAHAQKLVDAPHPFRIATGQVIVDCDDVNALARERVQVSGHRRHKRLALARAHFGDVASVQHHAANHLHVEMALAERAARGFAHGGESGRKQIVERLAGGQLSPELVGLGADLVIAQLRNLWLKRINGGHLRRKALEAAVVGRAENLLRERSEHEKPLSPGPPHPKMRPRKLRTPTSRMQLS